MRHLQRRRSIFEAQATEVFAQVCAFGAGDAPARVALRGRAAERVQIGSTELAVGLVDADGKPTDDALDALGGAYFSDW